MALPWYVIFWIILYSIAVTFAVCVVLTCVGRFLADCVRGCCCYDRLDRDDIDDRFLF